jgi:ABC-type sugar transport system ATPase subunit
MLYVCHDQEEAMTLGDRIAVIRDGQLQQVGPPLEVYRRPGNSFVAGFIGSPSMNFFACELREIRGDDEGVKLRLVSAGFELPLDAALHAQLGCYDGEPATGQKLLLGARPEDIRLVDPPSADATARVDVIEPLWNRCPTSTD